MSPDLIGQSAGLATALCFTAGSVLFSMASRQVGALVLNRIRLAFALAFLGLAHWFYFGAPYPHAAAGSHWFWLGLSGLVGLALGDIFLFQGYALIGPRLTMLMMSLSPILTAFLAWLFLGEKLSGGQIFGVCITISGIVWVVSEQNHRAKHVHGEKSAAIPTPNYRLGILAGLGAAICQSSGLILARQGLGADFPALSGNLIRMVSATAVTWMITVIQGQAPKTLQTLISHPQALRWAIAGAFIAPFLGVSLSLVAIQYTEVGIASTLMALPPVFLLPVSALFFKERFGWQAVAGTFVAVSGIALLFWV